MGQAGLHSHQDQGCRVKEKRASILCKPAPSLRFFVENETARLYAGLLGSIRMKPSLLAAAAGEET